MQHKVNGPEDAVVSEMIKPFPPEKIHIVTKYFQERFMGQVEAPSSWNIVKLVFFSTKTRRGTKEKNKKLQGYCADLVKAEKKRICRLQVCSLISKKA